MSTPLAIQIAVTFVWLGMVLAISFLEAPLKFRAPGITIPLGVGIGRLVFRALNMIEAVFFVVLAVATSSDGADHGGRLVLLVLIGVVLAFGAGLLRPLMDRKVRTVGAGEEMPRNRAHLGYIALELIKVGLLIALGVSGLQAA